MKIVQSREGFEFYSDVIDYWILKDISQYGRPDKPNQNAIKKMEKRIRQIKQTQDFKNDFLVENFIKGIYKQLASHTIPINKIHKKIIQNYEDWQKEKWDLQEEIKHLKPFLEIKHLTRCRRNIYRNIEARVYKRMDIKKLTIHELNTSVNYIELDEFNPPKKETQQTEEQQNEQLPY